MEDAEPKRKMDLGTMCSCVHALYLELSATWKLYYATPEAKKGRYVDGLLWNGRNDNNVTNNQTPCPESASELYRPSDRRLSAT
jgi:hypothetical protein